MAKFIVKQLVQSGIAGIGKIILHVPVEAEDEEEAMRQVAGGECYSSTLLALANEHPTAIVDVVHAG